MTIAAPQTGRLPGRAFFSRAALFGPSNWDRIARVAAGSFFGMLAANYLFSCVKELSGIGTLPAAKIADLLALLATGIFYLVVTVLIVVRRPPSLKSQGVLPRFAALMGSFMLGALALFPRHQDLGPVVTIMATALIFGGTVGSALVLGWLGRSFSIMPEARRLVTGGPYRHVRHPLYLAEMVSTLGVFIEFASPWTAIVLAIHIGYQIRRMRYEEAILAAAFPDYTAYASRTWRLVPFIW